MPAERAEATRGSSTSRSTPRIGAHRAKGEGLLTTEYRRWQIPRNRAGMVLGFSEA